MTVIVHWTDYNDESQTTSFENEREANIFVKGLEAEERGHSFDHISYLERREC